MVARRGRRERKRERGREGERDHDNYSKGMDEEKGKGELGGHGVDSL